MFYFCSVKGNKHLIIRDYARDTLLPFFKSILLLSVFEGLDGLNQISK